MSGRIWRASWNYEADEQRAAGVNEMFTHGQSGKSEWPLRSGAGAGVALAAALCLALLPGRALAQDDGQSDAPPSAAEIVRIKAKSAQLLEAVAPAPKGLFAKADRPMKTLEMAGGTVHWGNLFGAKEMLALTNLAPLRPAEEHWDYPPQYLCLFAWVKGHWVFRQFLGNAYDLEFHEHQGTYFLQGDYREGRYEGEYLSWVYDLKARKLVETHFEDWGPFYLAGDYLVCTDGFQRLAHDWSHAVYRYENHRKGSFVARVNENDSGRFDITFHNSASGKMETWFFFPDSEQQAPVSVTVCEGGKDDGSLTSKFGAGAPIGWAGWSLKEGSKLSSDGFFQLLTGLSANILGDEWLEKLPPITPLKFPFIKATGDPEIVKRLKGRPRHR